MFGPWVLPELLFVSPMKCFRVWDDNRQLRGGLQPAARREVAKARFNFKTRVPQA